MGKFYFVFVHFLLGSYALFVEPSVAQMIDLDRAASDTIEICKMNPNNLDCKNMSNFGMSQSSSGKSSLASDATNGSSSQQTVADPASALGICEQASKDAKNFCSDPINYSTDGEVSLANSKNAGLVGNMLMVTASTVASANGAKGTAAICKLMKGTGAGLAGVNTVFATRCNNFVSDCETKCEAALTADKASGGVSRSEITTYINVCKAQTSKAVEMGGSAMQSLYASQMGRLCEEAATAAQKPLAVPNIDTAIAPVDCSNAINAANPICRSLDPASTQGTGTTDFAGSGSGDKGSAFALGDAEDGLSQEGVTGGQLPAGEIKNPGIANGGGSMLGGGDKSGMGGGEDRGGRGQGPGYNANVLQGERGGGGYSQGGGSGGGWSGYGGNDENRAKSSPFDMSKFLPGQEKGPARGLAGLGSARMVLAPMKDDIFKRISDQVQVACKTRFLNCND
ncbi:MAG: hypothetical protein K1X29_09805 [Bdellovibrionales bacterium]|nr:hypothetical protein [Bdellovibrionales bacterium]